MGGHSYRLLAKNAPQPSHYRIRIEGAEPSERWVGVDCGNYSGQPASGDVQNSGAGSRSSDGRPAEAVLSLGWEPGFCEGHVTKAECADQTLDHFDATHFTLHGLWPQPRRREYCNVSQAQIDTDRKRDWQSLPEVELDAATRTQLITTMPGTQSFLDRHEWIRHGTCYGRGDPETYFHEALSLLDERSTARRFRRYSRPISVREISLDEVRTAFDAAFGSGAGDRIRLSCKRDGSRRLITEVTIGLAAQPGDSNKLADLIKASATTDPGCRSGIIDPVGFQ